MPSQSGIFGQVQIQEVLRIINWQRETGVMRIVSKDGGTTGTLFIQKGEIVHALAGGLDGEQAAYDLLAVALLPGSSYSYKSPNAVATLQPKTIARSYQDLVFQAGKNLDTKKRVYAAFPDTKVVPYYLDETARTNGVKLHDEDLTVATAIDGRLDFSEITTATGFHELTVMQTACMLKDANVIGVVSPHAQTTVRRKRKIPLMSTKQAVLPAKLETWWRSMPPFAKGPISKVAITTPSGARHELFDVKFDPKLSIDEVAFTDDHLAEFGLQVGEQIWLKPA